MIHGCNKQSSAMSSQANRLMVYISSSGSAWSSSWVEACPAASDTGHIWTLHIGHHWSQQTLSGLTAALQLVTTAETAA